MRAQVAVRAVVLLLFSMILTTTAAVAQFWEKKPYQQWSKDETQKILNDSPWSRAMVLTDVKASVAGNNLSTGNNTAGSKITYLVQVRSAQPVRAAIVHMQQLSHRYQQMPAEQKQRIDASAETFINGKSDEISFWVTYSCDVPSLGMDLTRYWETQTMGSLSNTIFLQVTGSQKLDPTYFAPGPNNSFEIRFPRPKDLPAEGSLTLQFRHLDVTKGLDVALRTRAFQNVLTEFKVKKMAVNGTPAY